MTKAAFGHVAQESLVNLSRGPILCCIKTSEALPSDAWGEVQFLANAVIRVAEHLDLLISQGTDP